MSTIYPHVQQKMNTHSCGNPVILCNIPRNWVTNPGHARRGKHKNSLSSQVSIWELCTYVFKATKYALTFVNSVVAGVYPS